MRGAAILLVVVFHAETIMSRFIPGGHDASPVALLLVLDLFAPYRMPTLMFLSGMLLSRSLSKSTHAYFGGKLRGIAWPYVLWTVVFLAVSDDIGLFRLLQMPIVSPTYLWYLQFLFYYYVIAWVITRSPLRWVPAWFPLLVAGAGALGPDQYRISRFFYLFFFFWLGHLVANNRYGLRSFIEKRAPTVGIASLILVVVVAVAATQIQVQYRLAFIIGPIALCVLVVGWVPLFGAWRPLVFVGQHSIVFYATHFSVIWICDWWLSQLTTSPWILWLAGSGAALIIGALMAHLRARGALAWAFEFPRLPFGAAGHGPGILRRRTR